jgi:uncharacterized protein (DUF302 family)
MALLLALSAMGVYAQGDYVVSHRVAGRFADVKENVVASIEKRGLVINTVSHVGNMLDRTGQDVGSSRRIYEEAEVLEFCSAKVSREVMEADPRGLALCPYAISLYTLPGKPEVVHVVYRRFPPAPAARPAARLVADIVRDAIK